MGAEPNQAGSNAASKRSEFRAFLSYSHADANIVGKLHAKLEAYKLPKELGTIGALNRRDGRLGRVFRDREDFSAAHDLSAAIKDALNRSQVLVVVCSPDARASRWVAEEIAYFKQQHPDRPILAAVVRGQPEEAIPQALFEGGVEPLAADLRKEGDGPRLGFLKVVAGIAGVPLDALIERDGQRQTRRVMAVTGVVAMIALAMGVMTTIALQARNEAQFQRDEAEGMVGYLIGDLRTQLRGVGRPDLMSGVNERALEYYNNQGDLSGFSDDSLERRARVLHALGEDVEYQCDFEGALAFFEEASATTSNLLDRSPNNPERVFAHAQSEFWVGYAAWQMRDLDQTERHWRGYLDQATRLAKLEPETPRTEMELGYAKGNMCEVLGTKSETYQQATNFCREAIGHLDTAVSMEPENQGYQSTLANRHGWTADMLLKQGRFDEAKEHRAIEQDIIENLASQDPENFDLQLRATYPKIGLGEIAMAEEQHSAAMSTLADASDQLARLATIAPTNAVVTEVQLRTLLSRERAHKAAGDRNSGRFRAQAKALFESTVERLEEQGRQQSCGALKRFERLLK